MELTHLSLFTGIGGLDLAAEWAGFRTVGQCEWADYPTKVLEKHWPDVVRWRDIRTLTKESFYERTGLHTVDIISGGFPCQPFSQAGRRKGEDDDRYLWPEMLRVISEIRPIWIIGENVPGILTMGIEICLSQLEHIGYSGGVLQIPACAVGAKFRGDRIFIVASSNSERRGSMDKSIGLSPSKEYIEMLDSWGTRQDNLPLDMAGFFADPSSRVKRNDNGITEGVHRLKAIGNMVVPQQAYPIFKAIAEIELGS